MDHQYGKVKWGPMGERVVTSEDYWSKPKVWDRKAISATETPRVFCASLGDIFENWRGPMLDSKKRQLFEDGEGWFAPGKDSFATSPPVTVDYVRLRLFTMIARTRNLDWLLLTKHPANAKAWFDRLAFEFVGDVPTAVLREPGKGTWNANPLPNVWLGTSVENQEWAEKRIPVLLSIPAHIRFLSCEPMLGPVDASLWLSMPCDYCQEIESFGLKKPDCPYCHGSGKTLAHDCAGRQTRGVDWVIVGGESGSDARQFDIPWARSLRKQCKDAGVAFFMKQVGDKACEQELSNWPDAPPVGKRINLLGDGFGNYYVHGLSKKGGDMSEWPADLRVREFPE